MFEIHILKNRIQDFTERLNVLRDIFNFDIQKKRLAEVNIELEKPNIWKQPKYVQVLIKERSYLKEIENSFEQIDQELENIIDFLKLFIESNDKDSLNEIIVELNVLEKKLQQLELYRMFSRKNDRANCYLDIQAGSGGTDAQDWARILMRTYLRWAAIHDFKTEIIEESEGEVAGIKSATIKIIGNYAYGWLRTETGVHRLVRKSPFDSGKRRHTSFSSTFIYPEIENDINIKINPEDLRIDVYRASGAGGQHVNRTESAVRITHLPSGIMTQCQNNRSQHRNKDQAIKQIKAKLYKLEIQKKNIRQQVIEGNKSKISWGNQIRSYILDDSRIKDLRTGIEIRDIQAVLDGKLDRFIEASLKAGL